MNVNEYHSLLRYGIGCILCGKPAHTHHPRFAGSAGKKSGDWLCIPLCPEHHQHGGAGVAIHAGQRTFEALYGSEEKLLSDTIKKVLRRFDP